MIGLGTMHRIDQRLRQVFPEAKDLWFGGLTVLLCGDFFQLPPVMKRTLYYAVDSHASLQYIQGRLAYESFEYTAILSRIMRQEGARQFRKALGELRSGTVTRESWKLLLTRTRNSISRDEAELFNDAIRLFNTNELTDNVNRSRLRDLGTPVTAVEAEKEAHKTSHEDAENLYQTVFLAIGARIRLTQNVWVEHLINGSMGVIHDIDWPAGTDPRKAMPRAVLVKFDHYTGPALFTDPADGRPIVPILPVRREFEYQGVQCSRRQLPIALAYAITVQKAQGLTLERAVIDLSLPEFVPGQIYVAISRVKTEACYSKPGSISTTSLLEPRWCAR